MDQIPPLREEIFSQDGKLKIKQKTLWEYHMDLQNYYERIKELQSIKGFFRVAKNSIFKKK